MKTLILSLLVCLSLGFFVACGGDDDDNSGDSKPAAKEINLSKVAEPVNPCTADNDQNCHGYYKAVIPELNAELIISVNNIVEANLHIKSIVEKFTASSPVTSIDLEEGIIFNGNNGMSFRFKVNADGSNPQVYDINLTSLKSDISALVLKSTSTEYVYTLVGEAINDAEMKPNLSLSGLKKGNKIYIISAKDSYSLTLTGSSFEYNKGDISIEGSIYDNLIISGRYSDIPGETPSKFYLINRSYFENAELIITDVSGDTSPYSIVGADIKNVYAIQTNNYFAIRIKCQGDISNFWFDNLLPQGFPYFGMIMADNKSNSIEKYKAYRINNMSPTPFSSINDFAIRNFECLYIVVNKDWAKYADNEVEFYVVSGYLPEKWLDETEKVIVKLQ